MIQDLLVVAHLQLRLGVLVSELDAGLIVINLQDLDINLDYFALLGCSLFAFLSLTLCGAANSLVELHAQARA